MAGFYYLYCLKKKTRRKFLRKGIDKKKVYTLPYKDIEAVITELDSEDFEPKKVELKLKDSKWVEEKIRNHQEVIEEAMKAGTHEVDAVIPLKFLTLYKSEETLLATLEKEYQKFRELLNKLKGKAEWGVKIYLIDKEKIADSIKKEDEEIGKMKKELVSKPEGVKYFSEKQLEEKISEKINEMLDKYTKDIFQILSDFSTENPVINKLLPEEFTKGREMILNASYLIPQEKFEEFKKTVERLHGYYFPKGLWLEYSGPWPPYSFVDYGDKNKNLSSNL